MPILEHILAPFHKEPLPDTAAKKKQYKTKRNIGEGTYGTVKEALHVPTNKLVAIKSIHKHPDSKASPSATPSSISEAVHRELQVLQSLRNPNIIALLDFYETREKFYLVFELVTGGELYDRISKRGKFTERDAAGIVWQILEALSYCHDRGVVHRDLKPENLLYRTMADDSPLVVADFGVSNFVKGDNLLTTLCGSPMYAAPEVLKRSGHSTSADLWSLGVITYTMLVGYPPFDYAEDFADLVDGITSGKWQFDSPYWDCVSREAKDFVKSLMQLKPHARLSAKQAMLHPWILRHVPEAKKYAIGVKQELDEKAKRVEQKEKARSTGGVVPVRAEQRSEGTGKKEVGGAVPIAPAADATATPAPPATTSPTPPTTAPSPPSSSALAPPKEDRPPSLHSTSSRSSASSLPNLAEKVWPLHSPYFNPRRKLRQVFDTVRVMTKMRMASTLGRQSVNLGSAGGVAPSGQGETDEEREKRYKEAREALGDE
ncbi:hypothetical protein HDV00_001341 [Rhizophlyctis rosea]|nr:hypothetical protein HDV00_001341 [Rhizophlyctis rosea]